jgi:hypothetical protein
MVPYKYLTPDHPYLVIKNFNGCSSLYLREKKPFNCRVLSLLENIHSIIKDEIRITNSPKFSNLTRYHLCLKLRVIAEEIKIKYCNKIKDASSSSCSMIFKTDFTELVEKQYDQIRKIVHTKTDTSKHKPSNFGFPSELIHKIFKYLNYQGIKSYSQVDRIAYQFSKKIHIEQAQKLNYRGNEYSNAMDYLKSINKGLNFIYQIGLIEDKFAVLKNQSNIRQMDFTATLQHWSDFQLPRDEILKKNTNKQEIMHVAMFHEDPAAPAAVILMCGWGDHPDAIDEYGHTELEKSLRLLGIYRCLRKHPYRYKPVSFRSGPF